MVSELTFYFDGPCLSEAEITALMLLNVSFFISLLIHHKFYKKISVSGAEIRTHDLWISHQSLPIICTPVVYVIKLFWRKSRFPKN